MSSRCYIGVVETIYKANPFIDDDSLLAAVGIIFSTKISLKTLQVWKARLRKKDVFIPDRRKKGKITNLFEEMKTR